MNKNATSLHLFQAFGVELEYMIVDRDTLHIKPIADELLKDMLGAYGNDYVNQEISWSNELVSHVIEIKSTPPTKDMYVQAQQFAANIKEINQRLEKYNARLMPTAAHPWMDPHKETVLWKHDNHDIYDAYNRIFDCKGHGWSNLQSTHLNLPFSGDNEFARLHAAIRLVLPIIPALAASSPILEGTFSGVMDKRLDYYEKNQQAIPQLTGRVIPDTVNSQEEYQRIIYDPIAKAIAPHDPDKILEPLWLNSRGAIARFERGAIEIRIIDIQECPEADLAVLTAIACLLRALVEDKYEDFEEQTLWDTNELYDVYKDVVKNAQGALITNRGYLQVFGIEEHSTDTQYIWRHIIQQLMVWYPDEMTPFVENLNIIIEQGTLSQRIIKTLGTDFPPEDLQQTYRQLCHCLENNTMFVL